jgi:hypothetical protein
MTRICIVVAFGCALTLAAGASSSEEVREKGSELRAMPGYALRQISGLQMLLSPVSGRGLLLILYCKCNGSKGAGSCTASLSGEVATCAKSETPHACDGSCEWKSTNPTAGGFIIR